MKKLLLAILLAALLVIPVPATALAAPSRAVIAELDVIAVGGGYDISPEGVVTGTVFYAGVVSDAVRQSKDWKKVEGATISTEEQVNFQIDPFGNILSGAATGTITITITGRDHAVLVINFRSEVWGNIFSGPAWDVGTWKVTSASKSLHILKDAAGVWTAKVFLVPIPPYGPYDYTFAGKAWVTGNF